MKNILARVQAFLKPPIPETGDNALVLSGGGARASYQAGVLQYIAEVFPDVHFPIMTGVSAGAINAAHLANFTGTFRECTDHLASCWNEITTDQVFEPESSFSLMRRLLLRARGLDPAPGIITGPEDQPGLVDTAPLRHYLQRKLEVVEGQLLGVKENLKRGTLKALSITTTSYSTGQTVTWIQGKDIERWERPNRVSIQTAITVDHIMASTSLPLLFPAVKIGDAWYGDGGIRLSSPLSPAVHLGAGSILVISTRYGRTRREADDPLILGYPPAAQVIGLLMNAIFLDVLDQDALVMERINSLLQALPPHKWQGFRPINLLVMRPSVDLGKLAGEYELQIRGALRLLTRGLGTEQIKSPDWLSMLLFQEDYISRLMQIGWEDARRQHDRVAQFFESRAIA